MPLMVMPFVVAAALSVTDATLLVETSTVTVTPVLMTTVSPAAGTAAPPQVAVLLQLPVTDAVLVPAKAAL